MSNELWSAHLERLRLLGRRPAPRPLAAAEAERARRSEWTAAPPGRLGRALLPEIERYLEFFAVARDG